MTHFLEDLAGFPKWRPVLEWRALSWFIVSLVLWSKGYLGPEGARQIYLPFNKSAKSWNKHFPHTSPPLKLTECLHKLLMEMESRLYLGTWMKTSIWKRAPKAQFSISLRRRIMSGPGGSSPDCWPLARWSFICKILGQTYFSKPH